MAIWGLKTSFLGTYRYSQNVEWKNNSVCNSTCVIRFPGVSLSFKVKIQIFGNELIWCNFFTRIFRKHFPWSLKQWKLLCQLLCSMDNLSNFCYVCYLKNQTSLMSKLELKLIHNVWCLIAWRNSEVVTPYCWWQGNLNRWGQTKKNINEDKLIVCPLYITLIHYKLQKSLPIK